MVVDPVPDHATAAAVPVLAPAGAVPTPVPDPVQADATETNAAVHGQDLTVVRTNGQSHVRPQSPAQNLGTAGQGRMTVGEK